MTATRPGDDVAARLEAALDAVRLASVETLRWYGDAALEVTRKADASPVTQADIAAEGILRRELLGRFPDDGFLGGRGFLADAEFEALFVFAAGDADVVAFLDVAAQEVLGEGIFKEALHGA